MASRSADCQTFLPTVNPDKRTESPSFKYKKGR